MISDTERIAPNAFIASYSPAPISDGTVYPPSAGVVVDIVLRYAAQSSALSAPSPPRIHLLKSTRPALAGSFGSYDFVMRRTSSSDGAAPAASMAIMRSCRLTWSSSASISA